MGKHIFVIDDDPSILEVTTLLLEEEGYTVTSLKSEDELFAAIDRGIPDLLLMDVWLGETDGKTITKRLRAAEATSQLPIILFSALGEVEKITKEAGASGYLSKPFNVDDLLAVVKQHLPS